ncbi:hypothetical protein DNTS_030073 [Danionella cerebrum]|uniref:Uncharacterized protein n=1 Tax=Danionella cerebrum TaxID=2873325 RepID=A0A553QSP5_9TELE|nr:hypothetical protein DNTS_030073 [Danionella translucida]
MAEWQTAIGSDRAHMRKREQSFDWIPCKDFTVELGKQQIRQYMATWEIEHPGWLYSLRFLQEEKLEFKTQYQYEAQWSIPTPAKPIPKATASVYFIIEISRIKPDTLPVEVHFLVESNRSKHFPGKTRFREKWLMDVIKSKNLLSAVIDM